MKACEGRQIALSTYTLGEVGNLILLKPGPIRCDKKFIVHCASQFFIDAKLSRLQLGVEWRVLFINHFVTREVFGAQRHALGERVSPNRDRLTWNSEHEVHIDVRETGPAKNPVRLEDHFSGMNSPEAIQERFVQ